MCLCYSLRGASCFLWHHEDIPLRVSYDNMPVSTIEDAEVISFLFS